MKRHSILTVLLVAAIAACTGRSGSLGSVPPAATPEPSLAQGSPDVPPGATPSGAPSATPADGSPSAGTSASPADTPKGTTVVRTYFLFGGARGVSGPVPTLREIAETKGVATAAMKALLEGPNDRERGAGISTNIPDGTQLLGLSIKDGVATVDLSHEFESGGGSASVLGRLAQVVYTVTQFPSVKSVLFRVEGRDVHAIGDAGAVVAWVDGPVTRADYVSILPSILVDRPAWGAALGNPGRVSGNADVFEASFRIAILDGNGKVLVDQHAMATCGTGCRGTFDVTLRYDVAKAQYGTLRVYYGSAKDGSPQDIRDYPVWLTPAN
jgi:germination protein M